MLTFVVGKLVVLFAALLKLTFVFLTLLVRVASWVITLILTSYWFRIWSLSPLFSGALVFLSWRLSTGFAMFASCK